MKTKVLQVTQEYIEFDNGIKLYSDHDQDCCESHYLSFNDLTINDFDDLEFNLHDDNFFSKIEGYGISLNPLLGFPVRIPGYGSNNGYYSSNLKLVLSGDNYNKTYDITECQDINW